MVSTMHGALVMAGLGLFFGIVLAVAYRFLRVVGDPRLEILEDMLPGSNCGACTEPGCSAFAHRLLAGTHPPGLCTVATHETIEAIAEFLGVEAGRQEKRIARLHCAGGKRQAHQIAEYRGFDGCAAAAVVAGGGKGCLFGCLGLGDCIAACAFDAIHMNQNSLPVVDVDKCTACSDCVIVCPRDLFEIVPISHQLFVQCSSPLAGDDALALCRVACDACGRCVLDAAPGLIRMQENLPVIHYSAGGPAKPKATYRCPTGAIQWLEGKQFFNSGSSEDNANPIFR
uniref:Ion-translocating oxidoreductase complex subunit B n=1 Tax=Candidatus Kentrum sp. FM TaxID=2126340 RepID=A0A450TRE7_9GAMM|nr:MAG: electron transport complex, RnfABCDGE type, B subunit [Candidatus Kentron sp. FM]VFJ70615.1 MAG: electron transport complex, RnfABCDGE type, B subunit [Candidatus Kentron sp. FM]VFK18308.1 MAG: electron transport complex, RnfABCDGE type, B subunit [Candidatus Kentron sp. FM]